jgi:hypothetical protein
MSEHCNAGTDETMANGFGGETKLLRECRQRQTSFVELGGFRELALRDGLIAPSDASGPRSVSTPVLLMS